MTSPWSSKHVHSVKDTVSLQTKLHDFGIYKFESSYLMEITGHSYDHISHSEYRKSCLAPDLPISTVFTADPYEIDVIVTKELSQKPVTACDFESCSWSTPFCTWPNKFQDRYTKKPHAFTEKGPFGVLLSVATLEGRSYVFDVRKCGLTPALRWYLSSPNMVKIVWDVNCEKKVLANTFGITQATAAQGYYDAQHWARDARVQNGLKTRLSDFVALFRGIDISPQKEQFHAFNWNTPHWQFDDTKKAIYYSACDSLYNLQVAVGLATCLTHIPVQYKTIAHRLRRHGMKL